MNHDFDFPCGRIEDLFMTWGSISGFVLAAALVVAFAVGG